MASSSNQEAPRETTGNDLPIDLANEVEKGSTDIENFKDLCDQTNIDEPNQDGKTPLMIACLKGLGDFVKVLLEKGANPNYQCCEDRNTSLHFVCSLDHYFKEPGRAGRYWLPIEEENRISIVRLLLTHGARVLKNNNGLTPHSIAGISGLNAIVKFLLTSEAEVPIAEKVRSLELLGVAESVLGYSFSAERAHEAFCRALEYRESNTADLPEEQINSSLANCFTSSGAKECVTLSEITAIKSDEHAIKTHAFLVGNRALPEILREDKLWQKLLYHAYECLYKESLPSEGFEIFKLALSLESVGQLKLGVAFQFIKMGIYSDDMKADVLHLSESLIAWYVQVLMKVDSEKLTRKSSEILSDFADLLFNLAFNASDVPGLMLDLFVTSILEVVGHIHQAFKAQQDCVTKIQSVAHTVMVKLDRACSNTMLYGQTWGSIKRVKYVISRLLSCEDVAFTDDRIGDTVLHILMYVVQVERDLDNVVDFARILVCHGCPVDLETGNGETARDILIRMKEFDPDDPKFKELFDLISSPVIPLRLVELAARKILQMRIPYYQTLPPTLCEIVERGKCQLKFKDLDSDHDKSEESDS